MSGSITYRVLLLFWVYQSSSLSTDMLIIQQEAWPMGEEWACWALRDNETGIISLWTINSLQVTSCLSLKDKQKPRAVTSLISILSAICIWQIFQPAFKLCHSLDYHRLFCSMGCYPPRNCSVAQKCIFWHFEMHLWLFNRCDEIILSFAIRDRFVDCNTVVATCDSNWINHFSYLSNVAFILLCHLLCAFWTNTIATKL